MAHCGGMIGGEKPAIPGLSPLPSFHTNPIFQLDLPLALVALELDKIEKHCQRHTKSRHCEIKLYMRIRFPRKHQH